MNYDKLKQILASKNISIQKAANAIEKTEGWFHNAVKNDTMKVTDLENLLKLCKTTLAEFFGGMQSYTSNEPTKKEAELQEENLELLKENRQLRLRIEELEGKGSRPEKDRPKMYK